MSGRFHAATAMHLALVVLAALASLGCVAGGRHGFQVWMTNDSAKAIVVRFEGSESLGDEEKS